MNKNLIQSCVVVVLLIGWGWFSSGMALTLLPLPDPGFVASVPDPQGTIREAILIDGVPVAFKYDDVWAYSAHILEAVQDSGFLPASFGEYQFSVGTGGLDALLYTGATGQHNQGIGPSGTVNFEDPTLNSAGNNPTFDGWWGQDDQANDGTLDGVNGPVTVGGVLDYLHEFDPNNNIPVFYMDLNQTGGNPSITFSARVYLKDGAGSIVHEWALDNQDQPGDGNYDIGAPLLTTADVNFTGTSGTVYSESHNIGSGRPDFIALAPTMDLSLFDPNLTFVTEFHMGGLNDGFEEIFLTGAVTAFTGTPPSAVPEPSSLLLMGVGFLSIGCLRGFRKKRLHIKK